MAMHAEISYRRNARTRVSFQGSGTGIDSPVGHSVSAMSSLIICLAEFGGPSGGTSSSSSSMNIERNTATNSLAYSVGVFTVTRGHGFGRPVPTNFSRNFFRNADSTSPVSGSISLAVEEISMRATLLGGVMGTSSVDFQDHCLSIAGVVGRVDSSGSGG